MTQCSYLSIDFKFIYFSCLFYDNFSDFIVHKISQKLEEKIILKYLELTLQCFQRIKRLIYFFTIYKEATLYMVSGLYYNKLMADKQEFSEQSETTLKTGLSFYDDDQEQACSLPKSKEQLWQQNRKLKEAYKLLKNDLEDNKYTINNLRKDLSSSQKQQKKKDEIIHKKQGQYIDIKNKLEQDDLEIQNLRKEINQNEKKLVKITGSFKALKQQKCQLDNRIGDYEKSIQVYITTIKQKDEKLLEIKSLYSKSEETLSFIKIQLKTKEQDCIKLNVKRQELQQQLVIERSRLQESTEIISKLQSQNKKYISTITSIQATLQQYKCENQSFRSINENQTKEISSLSVLKVELKKEIFIQQQFIKKIQRDIQYKSIEIKQKDDKIKQLTDYNCSLTERYQSSRTEIRSLTITITTKQSLICSLKETIQSKERTIEQCNTKISLSKQEYKSLTWKYEQLKITLQKSYIQISQKQKVIEQYIQKITVFKSTISSKQTQIYRITSLLNTEKEQNAYLIMQITTIRKQIEYSNIEVIKLNKLITSISAQLVTRDQKICQLNEKNKIQFDKITVFDIQIQRYRQIILSKDTQIKIYEEKIRKDKDAISAYKSQIETCRKYIESRDLEIKSLSIKIQKSRIQIQNIQRKYDEIKCQYQSKQAQYKRAIMINITYEKEITEIKIIISRIQKEKSILSEEKKQLKYKVQSISVQLNQYKSSLKDRQTMLQISQKNVLQLKSRIQTLVKQVKQKSQEYNTSRKTISSLNETIQIIKCQLSKFQDQNSQLKRKNESSSILLIQLKTNLENTEKRVITLRQEYFRLTKSYQQKCFEYDSLDGENKRAVYQIKQLKIKITYMEYEIKQKIFTINTLVKEIETLRCGASSQIQLIKSLMVLIKQGKSQMTRFDDKFQQLVTKISQIEACSSNSTSYKGYVETNQYSYSQYSSYQRTYEENSKREIVISGEAKENLQQIKHQQILKYQPALQNSNNKVISDQINQVQEKEDERKLEPEPQLNQTNFDAVTNQPEASSKQEEIVRDN